MEDNRSAVSRYLTVMLVWSIVSGFFLMLSLVRTNPALIGPVGITVWFLILFSWIFSVSTVALFGAKSYLKVHGTWRQRFRYSRRQGVLTAGWLIGILAFSSLRQLSWQDVILTGLLLVFIEAYVRLRWP